VPTTVGIRVSVLHHCHSFHKTMTSTKSIHHLGGPGERWEIPSKINTEISDRNLHKSLFFFLLATREPLVLFFVCWQPGGVEPHSETSEEANDR